MVSRGTNDSGRPFLFSVVMPVYNVEKYLDDAINAIINQTIGFQENCELILVDDGSTDASAEICERYKQQYPDNIQYIKQKNAGPGAARTNGANRARGKYVSMPDSDDILSRDAFEEAYRFLEKHSNEIDIVSIKWELFEARTGEHPLNFKFTHDRIIDLEKEFDAIQGTHSQAFFKREVFNNHEFDPYVGKYCEDGRFMAEVLLDKKKYGIVTKPTYFYRKRADQTSSQDGNRLDPFWYLETPKRAWMDLFQYAKEKEGGVPKFIQYQVAYDLQWRFKQETQSVLSPKDEEKYKQILYSLLQEIDDDVIMSLRNIDLRRKLFMLAKKHGRDTLGDAKYVDGRLMYKEKSIYAVDPIKDHINIFILEIDDNSVVIEGNYSGILPGGVGDIEFTVGIKKYPVEELTRPHDNPHFLGEDIPNRSWFRVVVDLVPGAHITASVKGVADTARLVTQRFTYLDTQKSWSYKCVDNKLVTRTDTSLRIVPSTRSKHLVYEFRRLFMLATRLKAKETIKRYRAWKTLYDRSPRTLTWMLIPLKSILMNVYVIAFRVAHRITKLFVRKPVWLLMDRVRAADDSAEIVFRYIRENKDQEVNAYFLLDKKSPEFRQLKTVGKVLPYGGIRHKLLFLFADKVISTEATEHVVNPFGSRLYDVIDLYGFDFVFLQHGIIKDDISKWLNKYSKNIKMFVTSVKPEYESILEGNYYYDSTVVKLTGLPRYDNLENNPQNKIVLAPTWREHLVGKVDFRTGGREYNPEFKNSEYFKFYQSLMNDKRLLSAMEEAGLTGELYLHPSCQEQEDDFEGNETFTVMRMPHDYPEMKKEGNLLVTDFSSVAFDFGYLGKPVIYAHFDEKEFYEKHTSNEGYFSYEDDGFGPVAYTYKDTVNAIIESISNGCKIDDLYRERVARFFAYSDRNNSERVYEAIREIGK